MGTPECGNLVVNGQGPVGSAGHVRYRKIAGHKQIDQARQGQSNTAASSKSRPFRAAHNAMLLLDCAEHRRQERIQTQTERQKQAEVTEFAHKQPLTEGS